MAIELVGNITQLTIQNAPGDAPNEGPRSSPIFNDAGPLERRLREMAERGELDLPTPHWHIHHDPLPGQPRPSKTKKVITAHRAREGAGRAILNFPSQVMEIARTPPKRVIFDEQDTEEPNVLVVMRAGGQYKAQLKECRRPACKLGLTEMS